MITISVPTRAAFDHLQLDPLPDVEVVLWDGTGPPPAGAERIRMFVGRYDVASAPAREALAALPELEVIQLLSAGFEQWLPVVPPGVLLCNGRGIHGASTAELAVAGILAVLRDLPAYLGAQAAHEWERRAAHGITGRRVLILGAGDIGARIAAAVRAFDADVTVVARTPRPGVRAISELPALLPEHDVIAIAIPLTPQTRHLVDAAFLAALPDGALVANVARGPIVDTDALLAELTSRRLRAFLDVVDPEPLPPDHPLWDAPNLVLTPHVGGGTAGWDERAYALLRAQVARLRDGEPLVNRVDAAS